MPSRDIQDRVAPTDWGSMELRRRPQTSVAGDRAIHAPTSSLPRPNASTTCPPRTVELWRMLHNEVLTSIDGATPVK
jgi:hypothetical protein